MSKKVISKLKEQFKVQLRKEMEKQALAEAMNELEQEFLGKSTPQKSPTRKGKKRVAHGPNERRLAKSLNTYRVREMQVSQSELAEYMAKRGYSRINSSVISSLVTDNRSIAGFTTNDTGTPIQVAKAFDAALGRQWRKYAGERLTHDRVDCKH